MTSPGGMLLLIMLSAVTEMKLDLLVERTRAGIARIGRRGQAGGRSPQNFKSDRREVHSMLEKSETVSAVA